MRPQVLIFDDDKDWAELIEHVIRDRCDAKPLCTIAHWRREVTAQSWDAIVIDVQIGGSPDTGTDHAEKTIWEHRITSPVIVISAMRLEDIEKKHRDIFFDYIPKDSLNDRLPESIARACSMEPRGDHIKRMLASYARKFGILKKEFSPKLLDPINKQLFQSRNGKTIGDLISMFWGGTKQQLNSMGQTVFDVMREMYERRA